jgi:protein-tyrosine phosphatase
MAEGIMRHKVTAAGLDWSLDSAGTNNGYHVGESPHHLSQKVTRLHSIDISHIKARSFTPEDFEQFDRIYAMSKDVMEDIKRISRNRYDAKKVDLLMNELHPGRNMDVPDPWYGPEPGYHEVFRMIDSACERIIERYRVKDAGIGMRDTG